MSGGVETNGSGEGKRAGEAMYVIIETTTRAEVASRRAARLREEVKRPRATCERSLESRRRYRARRDVPVCQGRPRHTPVRRDAGRGLLPARVGASAAPYGGGRHAAGLLVTHLPSARARLWSRATSHGRGGDSGTRARLWRGRVDAAGRSQKLHPSESAPSQRRNFLIRGSRL